MTEKEAYKVLGLSPGAGIEETKKRYRQLIMQAHPDIHAASGTASTHHAQEINIAYSVLKKRKPSENEKSSHNPDCRPQKGKKSAPWNAPVNEHAYMEREVLQYAEGCGGSILGSFCIARGKYLWITEEDFPLFLLSIYQCSKQLLDEIDSHLPGKKSASARQSIQAELAYLLAQQFIDGLALLEELAKKTSSSQKDCRIFYIPATLETPGQKTAPSAGETLYPSRLFRHRLFLKDQTGRELGYLSFPDDRLYYVAVPLFEQQKAQIKIQRKNGGADSCALHLWIKLTDSAFAAPPENLNLQIAQLLKKYQSGG